MNELIILSIMFLSIFLIGILFYLIKIISTNTLYLIYKIFYNGKMKRKQYIKHISNLI